MRPESERTPRRVLGWDVLRGLCALGVATYHLLMWQGVAEVYPLGSYGVYLFFVLSGASLAYNYAGRVSTVGDAGRFLFARWVRLVPLFALVCVASIAMFSARHGAWVDHIPQRLAMNLSFAFGLAQPTIDSLAIGGWSLGIEAAYYLAFPAMLWVVGRPKLAVMVTLALVAVQASWIYRTVGGPGGFDVHAYHQVPAFVAYFFLGCVVGRWRRLSGLSLRWGVALGGWAAVAGLLVLLNSPTSGDELVGWRAVLLFGACIAVTCISGFARVPDRITPLARWLGDVTYGCYLLHPLAFFSIAWFVLPAFGVADAASQSLTARMAILGAVLFVACTTAAASERWFERPLREKARRWLRRPSRSSYIDASSIAR